jgi:hypothetical protein
MGWQNNLFQLLIVEGSGPGSGFFVYSGAPGPGNPPVLSAVAPGVTADPFGNPVISVLELSGAAGVMTITDPALIQFLSGSTVTGSLKSENAAQSLQINGPQGISLTGGDVFLGSNGTGRAHIYAGADSSASAPMSWVAFTGLNFLNGWSGTFKWRYGAENEIKFQCGLSPGTDTDGTIIGNIGGATPAASQTHAVWANALRTGAVGTATEGAALQLDTSGNVRCLGIAAAATSVTGVGFWPLDN